MYLKRNIIKDLVSLRHQYIMAEKYLTYDNAIGPYFLGTLILKLNMEEVDFKCLF